MEAVNIDTTPVTVTPVGAAMNEMFAGNSIPYQNVVSQPQQSQPVVQPQPAAPVVGATQPMQPDPGLDVRAYEQMLGTPPPLQQVAPAQPVLPVVQPAQPQRMPDASIPLPRFNQVIQQRNAAEQSRIETENRLAQALGYIQALEGRGGQQQQAAPEAPDLISDQQGYQAHLLALSRAEAKATARDDIARLEKQLQEQAEATRQMMNRASEAQARQAYGAEAPKLIHAATTAAVNAGLKDQFMNSHDPVGNAIRWYQSQVTAQRYGTDPSTVRQRVSAELMNDPQFRAQLMAQARPQPAVIPPPPGSISRYGTAASPGSTLHQNGGAAVAAMFASR